jgi:hypothetical protein
MDQLRCAIDQTQDDRKCSGEDDANPISPGRFIPGADESTIGVFFRNEERSLLP